MVEAPDTEGNFTAFNIPCDVLDSDFLMQPINEADYDSETQACVDKREGIVTSFYSHYVTKRRKKKNVKNCRIETPAPRKSERCDAEDTSPSKPEGDIATSGTSVPISPSPASTSEQHVPDPSFLMAPTLLGTTFGVSKNALSNAAVRRVACGRMPPRDTSGEGELKERVYLAAGAHPNAQNSTEPVLPVDAGRNNSPQGDNAPEE